MAYSVEQQLMYQRQRRARNIAAGLTAKGSPRKPHAGGALPSLEERAAQLRSVALEAITWLATKRRDQADLFGLQEFATHLPIIWWKGRDHFSIATLIEHLERERQKSLIFGPSGKVA